MKTEDRPNAHAIRRDFYRLALDWMHLRTFLPKPIAQENGRRSKYREYGHPAEWASDKCAEISGLFRSWHDLVADERNETPAPPNTAAEMVQIVKGWQYLEPRFEQLVGLVEPDALKEISDLHRQIRSALGFTSPRQVLPIPCPNVECGLRTLTRNIAVGRDFIVCGSCGYTVPENYYPLFVRIALDTLIETLD